jgi:glycosyltransferase involved in cell wall biosynthesis
MRILYFAFIELDIPNACQSHTLGIIEGLCNNGCKVDAIIPRPNKIKPTIPGTHFFYLWPWRFSRFGKLWTKCLSGFYLFLLCLIKRYDAIYARELELNPIPRWCARLFDIPYYLEINGLFLLDAKSSHKNGNYLRRIEKNQKIDFKFAAGLIVPSFPRSQWIIEHYNINAEKIHIILNGVNVQNRNKLNREISLKRLSLPEDGFYLGFLGSVWENYDLISTIRAMELCKTKLPKLFLIIIGDGPEMLNIKRIAKRKGLSSKIVDLGYIQPNALYKVMGAIDLSLMNLTSKGLRDLGPITTRFATYSAFQIPVIANSQYLEHYHQKLTKGLFKVPHENPQELANKILWLYNRPEERKNHARILYDFVTKNLTWNLVSKDIMDIINHDKKLNSEG